MDKINLLFINNADFILWEKHKINWYQTINDLNVKEFISFLNNINFDFPSQYLYRPCLNETDAIFRLDIMKEILSSSKLEKDLTSHSHKLKTLNRRLIELHNESNTFQKQYFYLRIVCEYG